ncbi:MAG: protein-methionine-sulfoxide reductase catalytic subunit MsrP [Spongiibacteraceae bacterium]|jgi:sulfoxide reductase catalytic subunit YedY|nr:protein-methionine-sulfoxide reductase catalytic subunit MsrP [Spongiibacteraceae bacterium]
MIIRRAPDIPTSEITPQSVYQRRREFMRDAVAASAALAIAPWHALAENARGLTFRPAARDAGQGFFTPEALTPKSDITRYNNFYEFGTDKTDPARYADTLETSPWRVRIDGEVEKPGDYLLEDLLKGVDLEERLYRLRCVEAWSMVIPWVGFPLADLLKRVQPTSRAKYVAFTTLYAPEQMRGQRSRTAIIDWPYREGLRMDEAMHPLTLMAVGLYGEVLPNQNGAPLRLVVPWKYGFKSIKSIVKISLVERQPPTTWQRIAPREYGFYANVNPGVDHPRWSQRTERRLPSSLFSPNRIDTQLFNGYEEQVAGLYRGMDLKKFY